MGVDIAAINMEWLIDFTIKNIKDLSGDYICVSNVHTTVMAHENEEYCSIQNGGIMAVPDGGPLSSVGRKRGYVNMSRTTGPDYLSKILSISKDKGYRHYFFGSSEDTLNKLCDNVKQNYPGVIVAGVYSPPFRPLTKEENIKIIEEINNVKPDFIWVGLGAPKQEMWMAEHQGQIHGLMVGVGAAFDYVAGNIKRAPNWMQEHNLEWAYRLLQDPRRLFMRYFVTNTKFIINAILFGR
ncbi:MAG: WecB/TagA/CpsF family glycosyltransferase [Anaerovibrio sp.]|uniref:WecB/TagA/CpsF family glycosyltransferase n=1 Tax=Anaerovibrio sp. TaxID=1872532 RepID=UPI0025FB3987|nr:WecB/TagA/CpsF family glycosyltransferase [Anaerovibrio sp.]MCR5176840.1 WecB/TagA/CpsF family glycosyltransferase [Anaerovibrio sp.]